jgi:hypothetical protein
VRRIPSPLLWSFLGALVLCVASRDLQAQNGTGAEPRNALRIPSDIPVLRTQRGPLYVPVHLRHDGRSDRLLIGIDYDELLLQFEGWSQNDAFASRVEDLSPGPRSGRAFALIHFNPMRGRDAEEILVWAHFRLVAPDLDDSMARYGSRRSAVLDLLESQIRLIRIGAPREEAFKPGSGLASAPEQVLDGSLTIYVKDVIELGSGEITSELQAFSLPVYVTHVEAESVFLTMGIDYDELFLSLINVVPASPLVASVFKGDRNPLPAIDWQGKSGGLPARITVHFVGGFYPQLLRHHLLDLHFELQPRVGLDIGDVLSLTPSIPDEESGERPDGAADGALRGGGQGEMDLREGRLYIVRRPFVRGDVDGNGKIQLNDVTELLDAVFQGRTHLPCLEAADVNDSGIVDLSDSIALLNFLFRAGVPPPAPFPSIGFPDPDAPHLGCDEYGPPFFRPLSGF